MEVGFYKDVYHVYMVVDREAQAPAAAFEEQLLHNKEIPGLLCMKMEYMGEQCKYYYDIGRMKSIENLNDDKRFDYKLILGLFESIRGILSVIDNYLLQPESLWLEPEGIFKLSGEEKYYFAYIPGYAKDFREQLKELLSWLMKNIDHGQKNTVMLVYGLYKQMTENDSAAAVLENLEHAEAAIKKERTPAPVKKADPIPKSIEYVRENIQKPTAPITFVASDAETKKDAAENKDIKIKGSFVLYLALAVALLLIGIILMNSGVQMIYRLTGLYLQIWVIPTVFAAAALCVGAKGIKLLAEQRSQKEGGVDDKEFWKESQRPDYSSMHQEATSLLDPKMTKEILVLKRKDGDRFEQDVVYVTSTPFVIGKQYDGVDYHLSDPVVSRRHIEIRKEGRHYVIIDLSSTNGTWINGNKLDSGVAYEIKSSDMLKIANIPFSVELKVKQ